MISNCNKVKALNLNAEKSQIAEAVAASKCIEMNTDLTAIRRIDNKLYPELKVLNSLIRKEKLKIHKT